MHQLIISNLITIARSYHPHPRHHFYSIIHGLILSAPHCALLVLSEGKFRWDFVKWCDEKQTFAMCAFQFSNCHCCPCFYLMSSHCRCCYSINRMNGLKCYSHVGSLHIVYEGEREREKGNEYLLVLRNNSNWCCCLSGWLGDLISSSSSSSSSR